MTGSASRSTGVVTWILGSILIAVLLTVGGFTVRRADAVADKQESHSNLLGHPRMIERVDGLKEDIAQLQVKQNEQTMLLQRIDRNTAKR